VKRLSILTALLATTACLSSPVWAQEENEEPASVEEGAAETAPGLLEGDAQTLRAHAEELLATRNGLVEDFERLAAELEATEDLNAMEGMRIDLNSLQQSIAVIDADLDALGLRIAELEAGEAPAEDVQMAEAEEIDAPVDDGSVAPETAADEDVELAEGDTSPVVPPPTEPIPNFLDYRDSELVSVLVSDEIATDDIAIMGIVSGARKFCGLNWEPGFVDFIMIANQNGWDLDMIADEHGFFMGGATKSLRDSGYQCIDDDLVALRAITPY